MKRCTGATGALSSNRLTYQLSKIFGDTVGAQILFEKAAEASHQRSMFLIARKLHNGKGGAMDFVEARKWFGKSAESGYERSMGYYAKMLYDGKGGAINLVGARK